MYRQTHRSQDHRATSRPDPRQHVDRYAPASQYERGNTRADVIDINEIADEIVHQLAPNRNDPEHVVWLKHVMRPGDSLFQTLVETSLEYLEARIASSRTSWQSLVPDTVTQCMDVMGAVRCMKARDFQDELHHMGQRERDNVMRDIDHALRQAENIEFQIERYQQSQGRQSAPAASGGSSGPRQTALSQGRQRSTTTQRPADVSRTRSEPTVEGPYRRSNAAAAKQAVKETNAKQTPHIHKLEEGKDMEYADHRQPVSFKPDSTTRVPQKDFWGVLARGATFNPKTVDASESGQLVDHSDEILLYPEVVTAVSRQHAGMLVMADIMGTHVSVTPDQAMEYVYKDISVVNMWRDKDVATVYLASSKMGYLKDLDCGLEELHDILFGFTKEATDDRGRKVLPTAVDLAVARTINRRVTVYLNETFTLLLNKPDWKIDSFIDDWEDLLKYLADENNGEPREWSLAILEELVSGEGGKEMVKKATSITTELTESEQKKMNAFADADLTGRVIYATDLISVTHLPMDTGTLGIQLDAGLNFISPEDYDEFYYAIDQIFARLDNPWLYAKRILVTEDGVEFEIYPTAIETYEKSGKNKIAIRLR